MNIYDAFSKPELGFIYETCRAFDSLPLMAGVTLRHGGQSKGPYASFNLGLHVGDVMDDVVANRTLLARQMNLTLGDLVGANQVHGIKALSVNQSQRGCGSIAMDTAVADCDALFTNERGIGLVMCIADCMPLIIYDQGQQAIAVVHAGWRGVMGEIPKVTIEAMSLAYGTKPADCLIYGGPHIGPASFEVDKVLANQFIEKFGKTVLFQRRDDDSSRDTNSMASLSVETKYFISLKQAVINSLASLGIKEKQIAISHRDTLTDPDCFSYRKDKGITGRMAAFAALQ